MITRKEIAARYNCDYRTITALLKRFGLISANDKGRGRRVMLTPLEYAIFQQKVGEPIKR